MNDIKGKLYYLNKWYYSLKWLLLSFNGIQHELIILGRLVHVRGKRQYTSAYLNDFKEYPS